MKKWVLNQKPRTWQEEALSKWEENLKGIVKVVTGGGKTYFAAMCILKFKKAYPHGKILIVLPTIALLDQWFVNLQEDLGVVNNEIAVFSGQEKSKTVNEINLIVINTGRKLIEKLSRYNETFLIVDECHRSGSSENIKSLKGIHQASLGLSATPERDYDKGLSQVEDKIGKILFEYNYKDALKDNVISNFELINIKVDFQPDEQKKYDVLTRQAAVIISKIKKTALVSRSELETKLKRVLQTRASVANKAVMRIPVAATTAELEKDKRIIIFHEYISAANKITEILKKRNHNVTIYHSKINPIVRRDNLRLFRKGIFNILVTCKALDEGLNVPETSVAIIASSTASARQRIQRLGRVLRPIPGKNFSTIYTLYATKQEEDRLFAEAKEFESIVTTKWKKATRQSNK